MFHIMTHSLTSTARAMEQPQIPYPRTRSLQNPIETGPSASHHGLVLRSVPKPGRFGLFVYTQPADITVTAIAIQTKAVSALDHRRFDLAPSFSGRQHFFPS